METNNATAPKLSLKTMQIKREGQVDWAVEGDNHCGPKALVVEGKIPVKYTVAVTCRPKLDARGFLFDQVSVDLWIRKIATVSTVLSCEALCKHVAELMIEKMARDVPHCEVTELTLSLSPAPHQASITVEFGAW